MNRLTLNTRNARTDKNYCLKLKLKNKLLITGYVALKKGYLHYNWHNISQKLQNNKFIITRKDVSGEVPVILPYGSYSIKDINDYIINDYKYHTGYVFTSPILTENTRQNRVDLVIPVDIHISFCYGMEYLLEMEDNTGPYDFSKETIFSPPYTDLVITLHYPPKVEHVNCVNINCDIVNNNYQFEDRVLYSFIPNVSFGSLIPLEPKSEWIKTENCEIQEISIWLADQDGDSLEIEDDMEFTIAIVDEIQNFIHG